jgi:hypothetical protein
MSRNASVAIIQTVSTHFAVSRRCLGNTARAKRSGCLLLIQRATGRKIARAERDQLRSEGYTAKRNKAVAAAMASAANTHMQTPAPPPQLQRSQAARGSLNGTDDSKLYGGIKYERKLSGPFQGRFVSQGSIITIDGDDYVEYRVLTKPSFF